MQGVFEFVRIEDVSGVAGTGVVAIGFLAPNGKATMFWMVPGKPQTVVVADCFEDLCVHLHEGKTIIRWVWVDNAAPKV